MMYTGLRMLTYADIRLTEPRNTRHGSCCEGKEVLGCAHVGLVVIGEAVDPWKCSIRQHTAAYVSIRQHTSACVSTGRIGSHRRSRRPLTAAYVSIRQHTSAYVSIRQYTSACVSIREHAAAYVSIRQHREAVDPSHYLPWCQHLYFCASEASKLRTNVVVLPRIHRRRIIISLALGT
jgi:hypothetical protein